MPHKPNKLVLENLKEIDPSWLSNVFKEKGILPGGSVLSLDNVDFDHTPSYLSRIARFTVGYDNEALSHSQNLPQSIIVKVQPENEPFKSVEQEYLAFRREIYFYEKVAPEMPEFRLPRCYFAHYDEARNIGILILEDMSNLTAGDQIEGLSLSQIEASIKEIAYMHARWWDEKLNALSWLPENNYMMIRRYAEFYPLFETKYQNKIDSQSLSIGKSIASSLNELLALAFKRPSSLVHCDLRADNMRFSGSDVMIFDWQLITKALPGFDLGRLLGENAELSQSEQNEMVEVWHSHLTKNGVNNYTFEQALFDYKLGLALATHVPVINAAMLKDANPRTERLVDIMALRFFKATKAMQLGDFVQNLQS